MSQWTHVHDGPIPLYPRSSSTGDVEDKGYGVALGISAVFGICQSQIIDPLVYKL